MPTAAWSIDALGWIGVAANGKGNMLFPLINPGVIQLSPLRGFNYLGILMVVSLRGACGFSNFRIFEIPRAAPSAGIYRPCGAWSWGVFVGGFFDFSNFNILRLLRMSLPYSFPLFPFNFLQLRCSTCLLPHVALML